MAITANQRSTALTQILAAAIAEAQVSPFIPLDKLLPGVTPAQVLGVILNGLGTSADAQLTEALANMVTAANNAIANLNTTITAEQANITAWTVA